ncbi:MAG: hypothetical protein HFI72_06120 [Peptococcaceae bacterium]|nr:hypothetical protein [Peptococcaceae bacterium]
MIAAKRDVYASEYEYNLPDYGQEEQEYLQVIETGGVNKKATLRKDKLVLVVGILCMFSLALLYTFMAAKITMGGYTINALKADIETIENQNHRLTLEIEEKSSLKRIETLARTELGMIAPNGKNVYYVAMDTASPVLTGGQPQQTAQAAPAAKTENGEETQPETNKNAHPVFLALNKLFFE